MTRRLPWGCDDDAPIRTPVKKNTTSNASRKEATPSRASGTPKPKAKSTQRDSSNRPSARPNGSHRDRSLSTSPPPQPLPETLMIEGLENDDQYRMVEDEFFTVAGQFTAHLHAAEYQRLKTQTKAQNAETINSISHPVVGSLTELARRRQEELLRKKKQREALRNAKKDAGIDDESGDETMPWNGSSLQGLMDSPQKKEVPLMTLTRKPWGTGASSLFGGVVKPQNKRPAASRRRREIEEETEDDSDDLDRPSQGLVERDVARGVSHAARPMKAPKFTAPRVPPPQKTDSAAILPASARLTSHVREQPIAKSASRSSSSSATPPTTTTITANNEDDDDDDDDLFTRFKNRNASARQRRRVPAPARKEEKKGGQEFGDIIPTFI